MMVARDVATATFMRIEGSTPKLPSTVSSTGTMTMLAPTPSRPATKPATTPVRPMATTQGR